MSKKTPFRTMLKEFDISFKPSMDQSDDIDTLDSTITQLPGMTPSPEDITDLDTPLSDDVTVSIDEIIQALLTLKQSKLAPADNTQDELPCEDDMENCDDPLSTEDPELGTDNNADPFSDPESDNTDAPTDANDQQSNPDMMGTIRTVPGARLIYKRQTPDGTFKELWLYNIGDHIQNSIDIKKAILAGTDIPDNKMRSEDGTQRYELTTMGNAQMLYIDGLSS